MRVLALTWVLLVANVPIVAALSRFTCSQLADRANVPERRGDPHVCGSSRVSTDNIEDCPIQMTFAAANTTCLAIGMRLCTADEIASDETAQSGCSLDFKRVWSSTEIGCVAGKATSLAGASQFLETAPRLCSSKNSKQYVRCCADTHDAPVTPKPTSKPAQLDVVNPLPPQNEEEVTPAVLTPVLPASVARCPVNACSTLENTLNRCVAQSDGTYTCTCRGRGFRVSADLQRCIRTSTLSPTPIAMSPDVSVCKSDECLTSLNKQNVCRVLSKTQYHCLCGGQNWQGSTDRQRCVETPCQWNECHQNQDVDNKCHVLEDGQSWECSCKAAFYQNTPDRRSCKSRLLFSCLSDECRTSANALNVCNDHQNGTYHCECKGQGWSASSNGQTCVPTVPCRNNECLSRESSLNVCVVSSSGGYSCQCGAAGFLDSVDRLSCVRIKEVPVCQENQCNVRGLAGESTGNRCINLGQGQYECNCGKNWVRSGDKLACTIKACMNNECSTRENTENACFAFRSQKDHSCTCKPPHRLSEDGKACWSGAACKNDECRTSEDGRNLCVPGRDGISFECYCGGLRFLNTLHRRSCQKFPEQCQNDECLSSLDSRNTCVDHNDGSFHCQCGGVSFLEASDRKSCVRIVEKCKENSCYQDYSGNACLPRGTSYQCFCDATDFHAEPKNLTCTPKTCFAGFCASDQDPSNKCVDNKDGTFRCDCGGFGWGVSEDGMKCLNKGVACTPATISKCAAKVKRRGNSCVDHGDGTYHCECNQLKRWVSSADQQRCQHFAPTCSKNECWQSVPGNTCTDNMNGTRTCLCGAERFYSSQDASECFEIPVRCQRNECNHVNVWSGNTCTDLNDGTYFCSCGAKYESVGGVNGETAQACSAKACFWDECKTSLEPANTCNLINEGRNYLCDCKGSNWVTTPNRQSCEAKTCLANECSTLEDDQNLCIDNGDNSYVCRCQGELWYAGRQQQSCLRRRCMVDECSTKADPRNICSDRGDGTYRCLCQAPNFQQGTNDQSCEQEVCKNNECSSKANPNNKCIDMKFGEYVCTCSDGWTVGVNSSSCVEPFDPCRYNPCRSLEHSDNICTSDLASKVYNCTCGGKGWRLQETIQGQTCNPVDSACRNNPCASRQDRNNICIDNRDGTYRCQCQGERFAHAPDLQSCIHLRNWCLSDVCGTSEDPKNYCIDNMDGSYQCLCDGLHWKNVEDGSRCEKIPDRCAADPCLRADEPLNFCIDNLNGSHVCKCNGRRYQPSADGQACTYIPDPCINDPCSGLKAVGNTCSETAVPGTYTCICNGYGWRSGESNQSCVVLPDACAEHPCSSDVMRDNVCLDNRDGTYRCVCNGHGWKSPPTEYGADKLPLPPQFCVSPPDLCAEGDPCSTRDSEFNKCVDKHDGTYYCQCAGRGWTTPYGSQRCVAPNNPCTVLKDPCSVVLQPGERRIGNNECKDNKDGTYKCECSASGWKTKPNGLGCVKPVNECEHSDPCSNKADIANRCEDRGDGTYQCVCGGKGWTATTKGDHCLEPRNFCKEKTSEEAQDESFVVDRCSSTDHSTPYDHANKCIDQKDGTFKCSCEGIAWRTSPTGTGCLPPVNMCNVNEVETDFCLTADGPGNVCIDHGRAEYSCVCNERGYKASVGEQFCLKPEDPCRESPCGDGNRCLNNFDGTYSCECLALGWSLAPGAQRCIPPDDRCLLYDPCRTSDDRYNSCETLNDGSYRCYCNGRGWSVATDLQSCLPPDNPCAPKDAVAGYDPCSNLLNSQNYCVDLHNGNFECKCAPLWTRGLDKRSCICPDPCELADPCLSKINDANKCTLKQDSNVKRAGVDQCGIHSCTCGEGWSLIVDGLGQERCAPPNPCEIDRCSSKFDSKNQCINIYTPPVESFEVVENGGNSVVTGPLAFGIVDPNNPGRRQASAGAFPLFTPVPGPVLFPEYRTQPLVISPFPFTSVPLRRTHNPQDWSKLSAPGAYVCQCKGLGWTTPLGAQYCEAPDPCKLDDPCRSHENPDNLCLPGRQDGNKGEVHGGVSEYHCVCNGRAWFTPVGAQYCERCQNPCLTNGDACGSSFDDHNKCVWDFDGYHAAQDQFFDPSYDFYAANPAIFPPNWFLSQYVDPATVPDNYYFQQYFAFDHDQDPATPPRPLIRPATSRDIFDVALNDPVTPGTPVGLRSDAAGGRPTNIRRQSAHRNVPLRRYHVSDRFPIGPRTVELGQCGEYRCLCEGASWVAPKDQKSCQQCLNPCHADPCKTSLDSRNRCVYNFDQNSPGGTTDPLDSLRRQTPQQSSSALQNPFGLFPGNWGGSYPDQVQATLPSFSEPHLCGSYTCVCDGQGWLTPQGEQSCEVCNDPCISDPCGTYLDPRNTCHSSFNTENFYDVYFASTGLTEEQFSMPTGGTNPQAKKRECSLYFCRCNAPSYTVLGDHQSCVPCQDACTVAGDPCNTLRSEANVCVGLKEPLTSSLRRQTPSSGLSPLSSLVGPAPAFITTAYPQSSYTQSYPQQTIAQAPEQYYPQPQFYTNQQQHSPSGSNYFDTHSRVQSGLNAALAGNGGSHEMNVETCGPLKCQCDGINWLASSDQRRCDPICKNECATGDPCNTLDSPLNKCKFTPASGANSCGYYTCKCGQGFAPTFGSQGCVRILKNACQNAGDPCNNAVSTRNVCVLDSNEQFHCECGAPGFVHGPNLRSCILVGAFGAVETRNDLPVVSSPCSGHDQCSVYLHPRNRCVEQASAAKGYTCVCAEVGFATNYDKSACIQR